MSFFGVSLGVFFIPGFFYEVDDFLLFVSGMEWCGLGFFWLTRVRFFSSPHLVLILIIVAVIVAAVVVTQKRS